MSINQPRLCCEVLETAGQDYAGTGLLSSTNKCFVVQKWEGSFSANKSFLSAADGGRSDLPQELLTWKEHLNNDKSLSSVQYLSTTEGNKRGRGARCVFVYMSLKQTAGWEDLSRHVARIKKNEDACHRNERTCSHVPTGANVKKCVKLAEKVMQSKNFPEIVLDVPTKSGKKQ